MSHYNETGLAVSYKRKKTAAVIGVGTGTRWATAIPHA